jgi:hypothetical protein
MTIEASPAASERPVAITVICVISAIGIVLSIIGLLSGSAMLTAIAAWYPFWAAASIIVGAVCTYGLWMMQKWALFLYTAMFVVNQIILLMLGAWSIFGLVIPLVVLVICWSYQARMT